MKHCKLMMVTTENNNRYVKNLIYKIKQQILFYENLLHL